MVRTKRAQKRRQRERPRAPTRAQTAARAHAQKRAHQRYGVRLNNEEYLEVIEQIQSGKAEPLWVESLSRKAFLVDLKGVPAIAIYSKARKRILTFLPPNVSYTLVPAKV